MARSETLKRRTFLTTSLATLGAGLATPTILRAQPTTIEYWDFIDPNLPNPRSRMLKRNLERFEELNPGIKVNAVRLPFAEIDRRLVQGVSAGTGPDVVKVFILSLQLHVEAGGIAPLDPLLGGMDKSDWVLPWDSTVFEGKKMALPYEYRVWVGYYRADLFERAGVKLPKTWNEVCGNAPKLLANNLTPYAMGFSKADNAAITAEFFNSALFQLGADVVDAKGLAGFNNDRGLRFFQLIADLAKCKAFPADAPEYTYDHGREAVVAGRAAMTTLSSHQFLVARTAGPGDKLQWGPAPSFTGETPPSGVTNWNLCLGRFSKKQEAAWKFMQYMTSTEAQVNLAKGGEAPSRNSTYRDPWFATPEAALIRQFSEFMSRHGRARQFPASWPELAQILADECQAMVLKGTAPKDALANVVTRFNKVAGRG